MARATFPKQSTVPGSKLNGVEAGKSKTVTKTQVTSGIEAEPRNDKYDTKSRPGGGQPSATSASTQVGTPKNLGPGSPRRSGILLPLFSARSKNDFGIGDFGSMGGLFTWMQAAKQTALMTLPLLPTAPNDSSPYATRTAFGLNPLYVDLAALPEFKALGGMKSLTKEERATLDTARASNTVRYDLVMPLKTQVMRRAFGEFMKNEWAANTPRAQEMKAFMQKNAVWLDDYATFEAISGDQATKNGGNQKAWWDWPSPLKNREPKAMAAEKERLGDDVLFHTWSQFVVHEQWQGVRQQAKASGVLLGGDEPFSIGKNSSDAWAHPDIIKIDGDLGAPPDAYSATGQNWGLPYFDFPAMEKTDYQWMRQRAQFASSYYDFRRIDHAVGYARQWVWEPGGGKGRFIPPDDATAMAFAKRHFELMSEIGDVLAEDLGVIPQYLNDTLSDLKITEYRVTRWESGADGAQFADPKSFPETSIATTSTHDTSTMATWWEGASQEERKAVRESYSTMSDVKRSPRELTPRIHRELLEATEHSNSQLVIVPWQDVIGSKDQTNFPGTTGDQNWTYRIGLETETLQSDPNMVQKAQMMAELTEASGRHGNQVELV